MTKDPILGDTFDTDKDGDPCSYHVEYLGCKHTHGWIRSSQLSLYGHKEEPEVFTKEKVQFFIYVTYSVTNGESMSSFDTFHTLKPVWSGKTTTLKMVICSFPQPSIYKQKFK